MEIQDNDISTETELKTISKETMNKIKQNRKIY